MDKRKHLVTLHQEFIKDPVLMETCRLLFDLANRMGLDGLRWTNLQFIEGDKKDPLNLLTYIICEEIDEYAEAKDGQKDA